MSMDYKNAKFYIISIEFGVFVLIKDTYMPNEPRNIYLRVYVHKDSIHLTLLFSYVDIHYAYMYHLIISN